jgi:putative methionine-R-sulfoxide reductase with GAF domain
MSEAERYIQENVGWLPTTLAILVILIILAFAILALYKYHNGANTISFFGLKIEPNKAYGELQSQFEELNSQSEVKSHILKLLNQTIITISGWDRNLSEEKLTRKVHNFYNFFLPGLVSIITKQRDNNHRIAIFTLQGRCLKIHQGYGYSPAGVENLELCLDKSKAGYSFRNKEMYYSPDITADPTYVKNPKSSKEYKTLLCIPILYAEQVIGVLNVDGVMYNSFDKDDINYITYFANAVAPLLHMELTHKVQESVPLKKEAIVLEQKRSS